MAYDIDNQSDYVKTLFIYLKNGQSLALTAQELHVHRNTVVYRIEKMRERFGGVFDSPYHNFQNFFGCLLLLTSDGNPDPRIILIPFNNILSITPYIGTILRQRSPQIPLNAGTGQKANSLSKY